MLSINKLILRNFITYEKEVFDFERLFDKDDILLVYGKNFDDLSFANDNGAGKTIIYQGIIFGLFNKTTRNSNKDLLIGKARKSMSVEIMITDSYNNTYWIKRYRKNKTYGNGIRFKINGKEKRKGTARELTNFVLDTLGLTYRRVLNTSIFESDDERSRFIYLGDKEGKALLSQMKGLEIFSKCYDIAKKKTINITVKIDSLENKIEGEKLLFVRIADEIDELALVSTRFENDKFSQIDHFKGLIAEEKETITVRKVMMKKLTQSIQKYLKIDTMKEKISVFKNSTSILANHMAVITSEENKKKRQIIEAKASRIGTICYHCGNILNAKTLKKHIIETTKDLSQLKEKHDTLKEKIRSNIDKQNKLTKKLSNAEFIREKNYKTRTDIRKLEEDNKYSNERIDDWEASIKIVEKTINTYENRIIKLKKERDELRTVIEERHNDIEKLKRDYKYAEAWHSGYSKEEIQSHALESTVVELNEEVRKISNTLTDGMVDIKLLTDKVQGNKKVRNIFEFEISDLNKRGLPFKEWSKGQKKRIEIIVSFALMNIENNLISQVFLDELFDGIDEVGITKIKNLLEEEARTKSKKFIVFSHSKDVKNLFYNQGHAKLKNGYSTFHMN